MVCMAVTLRILLSSLLVVCSCEGSGPRTLTAHGTGGTTLFATGDSDASPSTGAIGTTGGATSSGGTTSENEHGDGALEETLPPQPDAPDLGTGDAGDAGYACGDSPLSVAEATALLTAYASQAGFDFGSSTTFVLQELGVAGLWDALHAQLFIVTSSGLEAPQGCSVVLHACQVTWPTDLCNLTGQNPSVQLQSGLVANGAFYYSWSWGSGIFQSDMGKLAPDGTGLIRIVSDGSYANPSYGPPPLVLQAADPDILVIRAFATSFNVWPAGELIGTLEDEGDRLAIVDATGAEIVGMLPP